MKTSAILTIAGFAALSIALNINDDHMQQLSARQLLFARGNMLGKQSGPKSRLKEAEKRASAYQLVHHDAVERLKTHDGRFAANRAYQAPEVKISDAEDLIEQGRRVARKRKELGNAYRDAGDAAMAAKKTNRSKRLHQKGTATLAAADANYRELKYAKTHAEHNAYPSRHEGTQDRQRLESQRQSYIDANDHATLLRQTGGKDTDSDSDSEPGPMRALVPSIHGEGQRPGT